MQTTIKQFIQPDNYCLPEDIKSNIRSILTPYNYRCSCDTIVRWLHELQVHSLYRSTENPNSYFSIISVKCPNCGEERIFVTNLYKSGSQFCQVDSPIFIKLHELQLLATYVQKFYPPTTSSNPLPPHIACRRLLSTLLKYQLYNSIDRYNKADMKVMKHCVNTYTPLEYNTTYIRKAETEVLNTVKLARKLHTAYNYNFSSNLITDFLFLSPANFSQKYMK